jgi:carbonic anhydrase/acetyltransferase-like protein (isoleucine patch superfamily)
VPRNAVIPARGIAVGVPARVIEREVDEAYRQRWTAFKQMYADLARRYGTGLGTAP